MDRKDKNIINIIVLIVLGFIFQPILQMKYSIFQNYDEIIAIVCLTYYILSINIKDSIILKKEFYCLISMLLLVVIGLMGNFLANIETDTKTIIVDVLSNLKIFFVYLGAMTIGKRIKNKEELVGKLCGIMRILVYITTFFAILNLFKDIGMTSDVRFGIRSFGFVYEGAGNFNMICYFYMGILALGLKYKKNKIAMVLTLFIWFATLRTRAFLYILVFLILYVVMIKRKEENKEKLKIKTKKKSIINIIFVVILICVGGYFIIADQVEYYFSNERMPRAILLKYGVVTMEKYFPLGAGFSTYGSSEAAKNYSQLYWNYGFNNGYGISYNNRLFLSDSYWPSIMGQFGVIGCIIMLCLLLNFIKIVIAKAKYNKYTLFSTTMILICIIGSSIATSSMVHYTTVGLMFLLGVISTEVPKTRRK